MFLICCVIIAFVSLLTLKCKMANLVNKIYKIITRLSCLIGFSYQLFTISYLYFSYETITNVKYEHSEIIELPAISFCYLKKDQINESIVKNFDLDYLSINDQFELMRDPSKLFHQCNVKT